MTWNYRVVRDLFSQYGIYEVYYDEGGNISAWTGGPEEPFGESLDELEENLKQMSMALLLPVLEETERGALREVSDD